MEKMDDNLTPPRFSGTGMVLAWFDLSRRYPAAQAARPVVTPPQVIKSRTPPPVLRAAARGNSLPGMKEKGGGAVGRPPHNRGSPRAGLERASSWPRAGLERAGELGLRASNARSLPPGAAGDFLASVYFPTGGFRRQAPLTLTVVKSNIIWRYSQGELAFSIHYIAVTIGMSTRNQRHYRHT